MAVPYMKAEVLPLIKWHDGDVVISVAAKSGTNWAMQIVYQLLSNGDDSFEDLYEKVPWLEFAGFPDRTPQQLADAINARPGVRAFKSHLPPPVLPLQPNVKYVVVCRNGKDMARSIFPFFNAHSDEWRAIWNFPKPMPDFKIAVDLVLKSGLYHKFYLAWWPHRHDKNVLFLHFADMKKDLPAAVHKIAAFLGISPSASAMSTIIEHSSFDWMKKNEHRIEPHLPSVCVVPPLNRGAMMREGGVGSHTDLFTPELVKQWDEAEANYFTDPVMREWCAKGGPLP